MQVWVISGPSGVGKGTVVAELVRQRPDIFVSISATTRPPRPGEVEGKDYYFVSEDEFQELIESGGMLEYAVVHGRHRYGTPAAPVRAASAEGRTVILEIDLQGARQVKQNLPEAKLIFLTPPSWEELVHRLQGRGTESAEAQQRRLATAKIELAAQAEADYIVPNIEVGRTVQDLIDLLGL